MYSCRKKAYADQASARLALSHIREKGKAQNADLLRVYPCDRCLSWHLTRHIAGRKLAKWDRDPQWQRSFKETDRIQALIAERILALINKREK